MRRFNLILIVLLCAGLVRTQAQDFPTNTPDAPTPMPLLLATNTPAATPTATGPTAPIDFYALRLWTGASALEVAITQINEVQAAQPASSQTANLALYELERRFPAVLTRPDAQTRLLGALGATPPDAVDFRPVVRPYLERVLSGTDLSSRAQDGLDITITRANLDAIAPPEAVVTVTYPTAGGSPFQWHAIAQIDVDGTVSIPAVDFPAAPTASIESVDIERVGDANGDGTDEVAISVSRQAAVNRELLVFDLLSGQVVELTQPGGSIRYNRIVSWSGGVLEITEAQIGDPFWGCIEQRDARWEWGANVFTRTETGDFEPGDTLACDLDSKAALFGQDPGEAIATLEALISNSILTASETERETLQRAQMTLAMLYVLDGQLSRAQLLATSLADAAAPESWLAAQTSTFLPLVTGDLAASPLAICGALENEAPAGDEGACDLDAALANQFASATFSRDVPVAEQLDALNIPVFQTVTLSEVGRFSRDVVQFDLGNRPWYGFAPDPDNPDTLLVAKEDTPDGFEPGVAPADTIPLTQELINTLTVENDPAAVVAAVNSAQATRPDAMLSDGARFLLALSYDLQGERELAREAYFNLWQTRSDSPWGQFAARHLERRG